MALLDELLTAAQAALYDVTLNYRQDRPPDVSWSCTLFERGRTLPIAYGRAAHPLDAARAALRVRNLLPAGA